MWRQRASCNAGSPSASARRGNLAFRQGGASVMRWGVLVLRPQCQLWLWSSSLTDPQHRLPLTLLMNRISDHESPAAVDRAREPSAQRILSMSPDGQPGASIESVLRRRIEALAQAIRDKNLEHLMTFYDRDVEV